MESAHFSAIIRASPHRVGRGGEKFAISRLAILKGIKERLVKILPFKHTLELAWNHRVRRQVAESHTSLLPAISQERGCLGIGRRTRLRRFSPNNAIRDQGK